MKSLTDKRSSILELVDPSVQTEIETTLVIPMVQEKDRRGTVLGGYINYRKWETLCILELCSRFDSEMTSGLWVTLVLR